MASFAIKSAVAPSAATDKHAFKTTQVAPTEKKKVFFSELLDGRFPAAIRISGALTTTGVNSIEHDTWGTKWSFGLNVYEQEDIDALQKWSEPASLATAFKLPPDFPELIDSPLFKDGVLYLKMPVSKDGKEFSCGSNVKMTPKKLSGELFREMPVDAFVNVQAFLSTDGDQPKWGVSFKIKHVDFWTDPSARTEETPTPKATTPTAQ